jgi:hypothetical protein
MKLFVERVSHWYETNRELPPCPGAVQDGTELTWFGGYKWYMDFETLEQLMAFVEKEGKIIIEDDKTICIYDDYYE